MSSLLFPVLKLSRENTQPVNLYVWHHFWKRERWEAAVQRVLYNECFWEISQNSQQSISVGIFFLIKLNSADLQLHEKRDSSAGVFLWILQIRKNTFFSKTTRRMVLVIAVSIALVMKGELANKTVNYDPKTMYQFEPEG